MKFQVKKCKGGWYWRLVAGNGKLLCHSEVYKRKAGAVSTMLNVKRRSMYAPVELDAAGRK